MKRRVELWYGPDFIQECMRRSLRLQAESGTLRALEFLASNGVSGDMRYRILARVRLRATDL